MSADILVVEDNPADLEFTLRGLEALPYVTQIDVARDGEEALAYLLQQGIHEGRGTSPRLVLLDLKLPRIDGIEVVRTVRQEAHLAIVPIVVLSSSEEPKDVFDCLAAGANGYVVKPVDYRRLREALAHIAEYWLRLNRLPGS